MKNIDLLGAMINCDCLIRRYNGMRLEKPNEILNAE